MLASFSGRLFVSYRWLNVGGATTSKGPKNTFFLVISKEPVDIARSSQQPVSPVIHQSPAFLEKLLLFVINSKTSQQVDGALEEEH